MAINLSGTNGFSGVDGSATTPALQGTDGNTGVFFGTDEVKISTGGSQRLIVDSSGRLGVGTTPATRLHVSGTQGDNSTLYITSTDLGTNNGGIISIGGAYDGSGNTTAFAQIKALKDNATVGDYGGSLAFFNRVGAGGLNERARIDSSGRLLVGTASSVDSNLTCIIGGKNLSAGIPQNQLNISDSTSIATGVGGAVSFGGKYNSSGSYTTFGSVEGIKLNATDGDYSGALVFRTRANGGNNDERMRIDNAGNIGVGSSSSGQKFFVEQSGSARTAAFHSTSASYGELIVFSQSNRSDGTEFSYFFGYNNSSADTKFTLRGDGNGLCDGSWTGNGADYAEYFEWEDGNPNAEDRRGYPVALIGNKIKIAEEGNAIIGIVSAAPVVLGDAAWNHWSGKFLKDDLGSYIMEPHQVVEWTDADGKFHSYEDWNLPDGVIIPPDATWKSVDKNGKPFMHRKLNPDYDPTQPYVPREDRPEWSPIGLMGKLRLRKGQPVAANWIKLRDISATVEEWIVR